MVKDQEYLEKKASYCLGLAKKLGATDVSVNVGSSISETVNFRNKKLDESNRSDNLGIDITTYIGKKKSSISSSNLLQDNLNILIEKCIETTKNTPEDEFNALPDKDLLAREVKELNLERANKIVIEATEQSNQLRPPEISKIIKLRDFLDNLNDANKLFFADINSKEKLKKEDIKDDALKVLLVGPEGDFSPAERKMILENNNTISFSLSKNILRTETATISALSLINYSYDL